MSIVLRITALVAVVCGAAILLVTRAEINETKRRYREATEEPLVDLAMLLAANVASSAGEGSLNTAALQQAVSLAQGSPLKARIYEIERESFELRIYVTDAHGVVIYDSDSGRDYGKDYSRWNDVLRALRGEYGARSSAEGPHHAGAMLYVAAPIFKDGLVIGALSVGKPTTSADLFIRSAKQSTKLLGASAFAAALLLALLLAFVVAAPLRRLTRYVRDVGSGKRTHLPALPAGEIRDLGTAFEQMRDALEDRAYVDTYVQTLAHALKSPLSGIRGAAELLGEELPAAERARFVSNLSHDAARMQQLIEKLLALSTIQREKALSGAEVLDFGAVVREATDGLQGLARARNVSIVLPAESDLCLRANRLWLKEACTNLLQNALEFGPAGSRVEVSFEHSAENISLHIRDHGPGIPEWAGEKIYEKFYSLPRPDSGNKSTGLGLAIVKEVAELHAGFVRIENCSDGGALATLCLPR